MDNRDHNGYIKLNECKRCKTTMLLMHVANRIQNTNTGTFTVKCAGCGVVAQSVGGGMADSWDPSARLWNELNKEATKCKTN